jgi:hypothetical protein
MEQFNKEETVWFMHDNKPQSGKIINEVCPFRGPNSCYILMDNSHEASVKYENLFKSKLLLLKSLINETDNMYLCILK